MARHIRCVHGNEMVFVQEEENHEDSTVRYYFMGDLFHRGFGGTLLNSVGPRDNNEWHACWLCAMKLKRKQNIILPLGSKGRQFVDILANEIQSVPNGLSSTERIFFFCSTVLQKTK